VEIHFIKIELASFGSFGVGPHTFQIEPDDERGGLHFIRGINEVEPRLGANGSGKSTIWNALTWCLYGKTISGLKNPDVKPRDSAQGKSSRVMVLVEIDGEHVTFERCSNPNSFTINGKDSAVDAAATIGLSFDLFSHAILFGQGRPLFFDLQPREKMELFSEVLQLDRWDALSATASRVATNLDHDRATVEGELTGLKGTQRQLQSLLDTAREDSTAWQEKHAARLDGFNTRLVAAREELAKLDRRVADAELALESAGLQLKTTRDDITKYRGLLSDARSEHDRADVKLAGMKSDMKRLDREIAGLKAGGTCPTCGQPTKKADLSKHRDELHRQRAEVEEEIVKLTASLDSLDADHRAAHKVLDRIEEANRQYLDAEAAALTQLNVARPHHVNLQGEVAALTRQIEAAEKETNPHQTQIVTLKQKLAGLDDKIDAANDELAKLEQRIARTRFWVKGFKDVRLFIMEDVLAQLTMTTNSVLESVGLLGWQIEYAVERETASGSIQRGINVSITPYEIDVVRPGETRQGTAGYGMARRGVVGAQGRRSVPLDAFSGGEGQRLRLVGAMALSEVLLNYAGVTVNLEIFDEPTRGLSEEGIADLIELLADRAERLARQVFLIDHQTPETQRFKSVTTIRKTPSGSIIDL